MRLFISSVCASVWEKEAVFLVLGSFARRLVVFLYLLGQEVAELRKRRSRNALRSRENCVGMFVCFCFLLRGIAGPLYSPGFPHIVQRISSHTYTYAHTYYPAFILNLAQQFRGTDLVAMFVRNGVAEAEAESIPSKEASRLPVTAPITVPGLQCSAAVHVDVGELP